MDKIQGGWPLPEAQWSRFFKKLIPTDEADTLASTFDKICVLASQSDEKMGGVLYYLYYIDLSSACKDGYKSIQPLHPILEFWDSYDGIVAWRANAVVGYKLFMFGGLGGSDWDEWSADWGCYDFSNDVYSTTTAFLDEEKLKKGPPMKGRKYRPIAAVVGGCKICVFSTLIYYSPTSICDDKDKYKHKEKLQQSEEKGKWGPPNFEVLDTRHGTWTELPELVSNYSKRKLEKIQIRSYCIEGSCLIVCTDIGIYGINIDVEDPKWTKMKGSGILEKVPFGGRWTVVGENSCSPDEVERWRRQLLCPFSGRWAVVGKNVCSPFEVARWGGAESWPLKFKSKRSLRPENDGVGVHCSERVKNGVTLCSVRGTLKCRERCGSCGCVCSQTDYPVLFVNVVKFDSKRLENMKREDWRKIQSDKSSTFAVKSLTCDGLELMGVFQVKETEASKDERNSTQLKKWKRRKMNDPAVQSNAVEDKKETKKNWPKD